MYAGRIAEIGPGHEVLNRPRHHYTSALLGAVPRASTARGSLIPIVGQTPHPGALAPGCAFAPRCTLATEQCSIVEPDLAMIDNTNSVEAACVHLDLLEA